MGRYHDTPTSSIMKNQKKIPIYLLLIYLKAYLRLVGSGVGKSGPALSYARLAGRAEAAAAGPCLFPSVPMKEGAGNSV